MGCCTGRCFVLSICILQLISTAERQVFDFLGYMWAPIVGNFFQVLCIILGFFGTYQYRPRYLVLYIFWAILWIGWNSFVICLYLEVGVLKRENSILNMGTGSRSWWEANGIGCNPKYNASSFTEDGWRRPVAVDGCLLEYQYVEVAHAGVQVILAVLGLIGACYIVHVFTEEDDSSRARRNTSVLPYSIEYQRQPAPENPYQRPMTPRKVKRRSTRSKRSANGSYRRSYYQNPVTKLMDRPAPSLPTIGGNMARNEGADSSTSNDSYTNHPLPSYSSAPPSYSSAASSVNIMGLEDDSAFTNPRSSGGLLNPSYQSHPSSRPTSMHNGRPSPVYMNNSETVI